MTDAVISTLWELRDSNPRPSACKADSAQYLKFWLGSLQQGPEYLKSVLGDVRRSSGLITQRFEAILQEMARGEEADNGKFRSDKVEGQQPVQEHQATKEL